MRELDAQFAIESLLDDIGMTFESLDDYADESVKSTIKKIGNKAKNAYYDYYADPLINALDKHVYKGNYRKIALHENNPFRNMNKQYLKDLDKRAEQRKKEKEAKKEAFDDFDNDLEFWDLLS